MNVLKNGLFDLFLLSFFNKFIFWFRSIQTSATGSRTCPICRSDIKVDGGFILADKPESESVKKTIMESLLGLPNDGKKRQ